MKPPPLGPSITQSNINTGMARAAKTKHIFLCCFHIISYNIKEIDKNEMMSKPTYDPTYLLHKLLVKDAFLLKIHNTVIIRTISYNNKL